MLQVGQTVSQTFSQTFSRLVLETETSPSCVTSNWTLFSYTLPKHPFFCPSSYPWDFDIRHFLITLALFSLPSSNCCAAHPHLAHQPKMSDLYLMHFRKWILDSPPAEWAINQVRELLIGALKQGPIPRHVAFEMDGNRRYARSHKIETIEGHHLGFEALARVKPIPWPRMIVLI
jgi:hypothetical protein